MRLALGARALRQQIFAGRSRTASNPSLGALHRQFFKPRTARTVITAAWYVIAAHGPEFADDLTVVVNWVVVNYFDICSLRGVGVDVFQELLDFFLMLVLAEPATKPFAAR